jgi:hypothetical protein
VYTKKAPFYRTMGIKGLKKIGGAGRVKTAVLSEQRAQTFFIRKYYPGKQLDHKAMCSGCRILLFYFIHKFMDIRLTLVVFNRLQTFPGHNYQICLFKVAFSDAECLPYQSFDPVSLNGLANIFFGNNNTEPA